MYKRNPMEIQFLYNCCPLLQERFLIPGSLARNSTPDTLIQDINGTNKFDPYIFSISSKIKKSDPRCYSNSRPLIGDAFSIPSYLVPYMLKEQVYNGFLAYHHYTLCYVCWRCSFDFLDSLIVQVNGVYPWYLSPQQVFVFLEDALSIPTLLLIGDTLLLLKGFTQHGVE